MELKTKQIRKPAEGKILTVIGLRPGETPAEFMEAAKIDKQLISWHLPSQYGNGFVYRIAEILIDFTKLDMKNPAVLEAIEEYIAKIEALLDLCGVYVHYHGHNEWCMHKITDREFCDEIATTIERLVFQDETELGKIRHITRILKTIESSIDYNKHASPKAQVRASTVDCTAVW